MWIRKDFDSPEAAHETAKWFRHYFPENARPDGFRLYSRTDTGNAALLARVPEPLSQDPSELMEVMKGWRPAREDAQDLGYWHVEI